MLIQSLTSIEIQKQLDDFALDAGLTYLDNEPLARMRVLPLYREHYILVTDAKGPMAGRKTVTWANWPICRYACSAPTCRTGVSSTACSAQSARP